MKEHTQHTFTDRAAPHKKGADFYLHGFEFCSSCGLGRRWVQDQWTYSCRDGVWRVEAPPCEPVRVDPHFSLKQKQMLGMSIQEFFLTRGSARLEHCINSLGLETVADLVSCTIKDFKRVKNMGGKTLTELEEELAVGELQLGMFVPDNMKTPKTNPEINLFRERLEVLELKVVRLEDHERIRIEYESQRQP